MNVLQPYQYVRCGANGNDDVCCRSSTIKDECATAIIKMNEYREAQSRMNRLEKEAQSRMNVLQQWSGKITKLTLIGLGNPAPTKVSYEIPSRSVNIFLDWTINRNGIRQLDRMADAVHNNGSDILPSTRGSQRLRSGI